MVGDIELLQVIGNTTSSLFQLCMFTAILATKQLANKLLHAVAVAANLSFKIDSSQLFHINSEGFLENQCGQSAPNDRFFVSINGKCIFPNRFNDNLEDSEGNPIVDNLKGPFFAIKMDVKLPDELSFAAKQTLSNNISALIQNMIWSSEAKPQTQVQDQFGAEPAIEPTP